MLTFYSSIHLLTLPYFDSSLPSLCTLTSPTFVTMTTNVPSTDVVDNEYQSRTGQSAIPVQKDEAPIESTEYDNGGDSDKQLGT